MITLPAVEVQKTCQIVQWHQHFTNIKALGQTLLRNVYQENWNKKQSFRTMNQINTSFHQFPITKSFIKEFNTMIGH